MRVAFTALVLLGSGFTLLVAGCDSFGDIAGVDAGVAVASEAELVAAQRAWEADGPESYRLAYELSCFCDGGDRVRVRGGRVVSTTRSDVRDAKTVDDLFRLARQAFAEGYTGEVRLSASLPRIPVYAAYDLVQDSDAPIVDGSAVLTVTGFEAD